MTGDSNAAGVIDAQLRDLRADLLAQLSDVALSAGDGVVRVDSARVAESSMRLRELDATVARLWQESEDQA